MFTPAYPTVVLTGSTLSWAPQNICGLWKLLQPPHPPLHPPPHPIGVGSARSIISTPLATAEV